MSQFENIMKGCLKDFSIGNKGQFRGFCASDEELEYLITRLQCLGYSYSVRSSNGISARKQSSEVTGSKPRVLFQLLQGDIDIPFTGLPFTVEFTIYRQCTFGPKYYDKGEIVVPDHLADHFIPNKKRKLSIETKKSDCPATFTVKCIRFYSGLVVKSVNDRKRKKKVIEDLKQQLQSPSKPESFLRFYVAASPPDHHTHSVAHMIASGELHPQLAMEIKNLVRNGTTSTKEIKLLLERLVERTFSEKPDRTNTKFYPTERTIHKHVYKIRKEIFDSLETQVNEAISCGTQSECIAENNSVRYDVESASCNGERNKEHLIPETSNSPLHQEARQLCKNIRNLTYICGPETLKKLIEDLKTLQCYLELKLQ